MKNRKEQRIFNDENESTFSLIKAAVGFGGLLLIYLNKIYGFALPNTSINCLADYTFDLSASLNVYFSNNLFERKLLLIFSSICVDLIMVILGICWILYGKSWRLICSLITFYSFKLLVQLIYQQKAPDGYLWDYPDFPSIMVSYLPKNTFFYSTVMGFLTIACLEFYKMRINFLCILSIATGIIEFSTRNILRGNYIIDMLSAIILAHLIFIYSNEICTKYIDCVNIKWINMRINKDKDADSSISTAKYL